ncbi:MAG: potassium-transporting ATPase subunit KdpA [Candidatus Melainabacteria bacterium]|nr:potassium-transporting ATPase subunit KdpA [Candidatus Melainabacteria bacterium]
MLINEILFVVILFFLVLVLAVPLGEYIAKVFKGENTFSKFLFEWFEKLIYKISGINANKEMSWKTYMFSLLVFSVLNIIFLFLLQELQGYLPLNHKHLGPVRWDTALNAAISFVTNTNWQSYSGEKTMSYLTQMLGFAVQNFISAAVGIAVCIAFIRGFARPSINTIGNFYVDLTRGIVYILLPLSIILAFIFISEGVIQSLKPYVMAQTLEGNNQTIPLGPVASQIAIKFLGTNGGGFFNANSAHPFENPTPVTNFLGILALLLIPIAMPFTFGAMINSRRQGWSIFSTMSILFLVEFFIATYFELQGNPLLKQLGVTGGTNMEGKEVRFGIISSVLFAHSTTSTACGGVCSMHDSFTPLSGLILLFNMGIGEVIFGGVGVGLIGLLIYAVLTMFIVGLMIGRSPEFLGKKLEPFEMLMAVICLLSPPLSVLIFGGIAISIGSGLSSLNNLGPHGLSEILYAFASMSGNNGSAFAGLNANTPFYNLLGTLAMLIGRFTTLIPALAISGSLSQKRFVPKGSATFTTDIPLFVWLLVVVVIIIGGLTYLPVLTLGPILEHMLMHLGNTF